MANFLKSLFVKGIEIDPDGATSAQVLSYNGTKFVPVTNSATATIDASALTQGTLDNARLPAAATNITSVGTLGSLAVTNGVTAATFTGALTGNASTATNVAYTGLTGTVTTWNQNTTGTAATVTTNANLTGDVTSVGNATTLTNAPVIAKVLTGYVSGSGTVAATDSILQAVQKLNGNDALKATIANPTFTGTVTAPIVVGTLIGSAADTDSLRISGGYPDNVTVGGNMYLYGNTHATRAADVAIQSNGTEVLTVDSTGRVGILNTAPATALDVTGTVTATAFTGAWNGTVVAGQYGGTGVANTGKTITLGGNLTTSGAFATTLTATAATTVTLPTTGTLATLAGTETLTNKTLTTPVLGVATGTSFTGTASNHQNNFVKLSASANDSTTMWGYTASAPAYANLRTYCAYDIGVSWISNGSTGPSGYTPNAHAVFMAGTTISGDIRSGATNTTTYSTSSDYRLKENITEINDAIERIRRLRPVSFQFKDPNNDIVYDGFLAHEVQEVISYAVGGQKDAVTADGEIMPQMIDMSTMVGLLTAGIKELDARLAQLETI